MKRLLNWLVVTNTEEESVDATDDSGTSTTVEWADLSGETSTPVDSAAESEPTPSADSGPPTRAVSSAASTPETADTDEVDTMDAYQLLGNVLDGLAVPTFVVDSAGHISHINSNACGLFETTESAAVGAAPAAVHGGEDLTSHVLSSGEEITERRETVTVDGEERTLSRTITPFQDGSGEIVGAMETARDVTELVREETKTEEMEAYQKRVLEDLQDKIVRLAEGDLTIEPTVPEPTADFEELRTTHEQFAELNGHLTTAVDNYRQVLSRLTLLADDLDDTSQELSANSEEVTASIEEISQSTEEM
ncbi:MAG: PAS domain-containing protein, partial [Halohasta sp.]